MNKKPAMIKLIIVAVVTIIGIVATFVSFNVYPGGTAYTYNGFVHSIDLGLDLQGGVYAVYEATESNPGDSRMNGTVNQLTNLLTDKGYTEATVVRQGTNRIRVEVPDVDEPQEIFDIIGEPAELEFVLSSDRQEDGDLIMTGSSVVNAYPTIQNGDYCVGLSLNDEGGKKFGEATSNNINSYIKIYVARGGGSRDLISTARITQAITNGNAIISGEDRKSVV